MATQHPAAHTRRRPGQEAALGLYGDFRLGTALRYCADLMLASLSSPHQDEHADDAGRAQNHSAQSEKASASALNTILPRIYAGR